MNGGQPRWRWWGGLGLVWLACTGLQRFWLLGHAGYLSWDQADYLNSAVDHGRALGCLAPAQWPGWGGLLNLSPKIPPLASLVNGCILRVSGDGPDQARLALLVWLALLLVVVACWAREIGGPRFGLLSAGLMALSPGLWQVTLRFSLDLPLTAAIALALWLLGRWHRRDAPGPGLTLAAAAAIAAAILIKQSALLFLAIPLLVAAGSTLRGRPGKRRWMLLGLIVCLTWILPWLHHNWITTLGGTNRAVFESAAAEGDPAVFSALGLSWYLLRLPGQLGLISTGLGALGLALVARRHRGLRPLQPDWCWILLCAAGGLLLLSLSPNKDERYLAPLLPTTVMLLANGWRALWRQRRRLTLLASGLMLLELPTSLAIQQRPITAPPIAAAIAPLHQGGGGQPRTVVVVPDTRELNEHTVTTMGRLAGSSLVGRHLSARRTQDRQMLRERADLILLGSGGQRRHRRENQQVSRELEADPRFERLQRLRWANGQEWLELWRRRTPVTTDFAQQFPELALAAGNGPAGLAQLMERISPEHQLDGQLAYQQRLRQAASARLKRDPNDREALWSLAMLAVLRNERSDAAQRFSRLGELEPANPWPGTYRSVVLLADWRSCQAASTAEQQLQRPGTARVPLLALRDVAAGLCLRPWRLLAAGRSVPEAVGWAERTLAPQKP